MEEKEIFSLKLKDNKQRIPTKEEAINALFEVYNDAGIAYFPQMSFIELYYKVYGRPIERKDYFFNFIDGKPSVVTIRNSDTYAAKINLSFFQTLYDAAIASLRTDDNNFILVYESALICAVCSNRYMRIDWIMSNDDADSICKLFEGATPYSEEIDNTKFYIAFQDNRVNGLGVLEETLNAPDIDIKKSYNDDIPYERMKDCLSREDNCLMLFYGQPGTGKTTLIKKLIGEIKRKFIIMDPTAFKTVSESQFLSFLSENKGSIIVLEDCEKLLLSRDEGGNAAIGTLLNLSDGIVGDALKTKILCTFNTDINSIDKALTRKGRLSLKYEFKKLSLEKTKKIYTEATEEMTLADIYNVSNENDFSKNNKKSIGF